MTDRPKKFIKGHNVLKSKSGPKALSKVKELEKKKAEEAETAAVLNEYIADFQTGAVQGKTFVRAGLESQEEETESRLPYIKDENEDSTRLYKPKSKMQELAEEFRKSKEISTEYTSAKDAKKKANEKKKSNLELFKEELERSQKERDIRRKLRNGDLSGISEDVLNSLPPTFFKSKSTEDEFGYQYEVSGSHDTGDPTTTNLFISNINPKMNEEQLCKVFGRYGPLASVKIMWPRTDEEKLRNRNCGFVAFMNRKDGEKALADIEGKYVMDFEMKIGWGKTVPIPPQPIYVHPSQSHVIRPPKQSGLPFNGQIPYKIKKENLPFDGNLENTVIKVVIPTERLIASLINRVVEFVVREGPMFEAMIMNREISNPMYRFLFDNKSNEHVYYRWRVFSLLQGDTPQKWNQKCFRLFIGGSIWQPPSLNPFGANNQMTGGMTASAALACASSANVHSVNNVNVKATDDGGSPTLAMKKNFLLQQLLKEDVDNSKEKGGVEKEKKALSDRQRDRLEDMLRTITTDRTKIGELMMWCVDHSDYCDEIVECICESLSILETPFNIKIARLFVVSDILHNSSVKVHNASSYRKVLQAQLLEMMEFMHKSLGSCSTKSQAEKFRKQVLSCLAAWQDWSLYPPSFLINLQNVFVGISTSKAIKLEEERINEESLLAKMNSEDNFDGQPLTTDVDGNDGDTDDIDGIPLSKTSNDIDGVPLNDVKNGIDGTPFRVDKDEKKNTLNDPVSLSRWERNDDEQVENKEKPVTTGSNKWEKVEGVKLGKSKNEEEVEEEEEVTEDETEQAPVSPTNQYSSSKQVNQKESSPVQDEVERRKLRDVELKVMRFVDKLEQRGGDKTGLNIQKEAAKFRQQLLLEFEVSRGHEKRRKNKSDRKRDRSRSPGTDESTKRRKSTKKRRSPSPLDNNKPHRSKKYSKNDSRRSQSISPSPPQAHNRNRSYSRSPMGRSLSKSPVRRSYSPKSPIFRGESKRSLSPLSRRSFSASPTGGLSPDYTRSSNRSPSPRYSPPPYSPKRMSSAVTRPSKKKSKKNKR